MTYESINKYNQNVNNYNNNIIFQKENLNNVNNKEIIKEKINLHDEFDIELIKPPKCYSNAFNCFTKDKEMRKKILNRNQDIEVII